MERYELAVAIFTVAVILKVLMNVYMFDWENTQVKTAINFAVTALTICLLFNVLR